MGFAVTDNVFAVQPELVARIRAQVPTIVIPPSPTPIPVGCGSAIAITGNQDMAAKVPYVGVYPGGAMLDNRGSGRDYEVQEWIARCCVAHIQSEDETFATEIAAGILLSRVIGALLGFKPPSAVSDVRMGERRESPIYVMGQGWAHYEQVFLVNVVISTRT